jgi:hypothetical protein
MKTFRIKMMPKKGGQISYVLMQSSSRGALWGIAQAAYPDFNILNVEDVK